MSYKSWDALALEQKTIARLLKNHIKLNRLNHAYIFEGVKGTKKFETALFFTKALMCQNKDQDLNPCMECKDCLRTDSMSHPNVFMIEPAGTMIKKDQIKEMINEFSKTSLEVGRRVNIIVEADKFNLSSANTLLKTMEEPGEDIFQIMITENLQSLLPTIRSRGEIIHFKTLDRRLIRDQLKDLGVKSSYANPISQYTSDIEAAKKIADDELLVELIDLMIQVYESFDQKKSSSIITFLEESGKVVSELSRAEFFLDFMILFQKDIIQSKLGNQDICYLDHHHLVERIANKSSLDLLKRHLELMLDLSKRMHYNINLPLVFNYLLMKMERGYKHAT
jgi:DNA polymerase-3 subunit delta'